MFQQTKPWYQLSGFSWPDPAILLPAGLHLLRRLFCAQTAHLIRQSHYMLKRLIGSTNLQFHFDSIAEHCVKKIQTEPTVLQ